MAAPPATERKLALPTDPVPIAQALVRCPSVTPAEGGALELIGRLLSARGFRVERPVFSQPGTPDVENLFARYGKEAPCFVFAGHTDVVPPGDEASWTHLPFAGAVDRGYLWGRGAVDMKGALAAALSAVLGYLVDCDGRIPGSVAFLVTADEEGPSINGTAKLLDWAAERGERFSHCLLGEPTNPDSLGDAVKIGRRGSLSGTITVAGRQGHVAYPHLADNPIHGLVRLLSALIETRLDEGSAHFEPSNLELVSVDVGNPAFNVIPAEARARFNIRFNDRHTPEGLEAQLREILDQAAAAAVQYRLAIEPGGSASFVTQPGPFVDLVCDAVEAVTGRRPALSTSGGTSDARFIKDHCPVVEFGLVGRTMHQVDERAAVADLERLAAIYRRILDNYFAGFGQPA